MDLSMEAILFETLEELVAQIILISESSSDGKRHGQSRNARHDRIVGQGGGVKRAAILYKAADFLIHILNLAFIPFIKNSNGCCRVAGKSRPQF